MTKEQKKELEVSKKKEIEKSQGEPIKEGLMYVPQVDIAESDNAITLYADLPGVVSENVDIDVREGVLTLTANVLSQRENQRLVHGEYEIGGYQRRFTLSERIDVEKINAKMTNGELTLILPKAEKAKPRKIEVTT